MKMTENIRHSRSLIVKDRGMMAGTGSAKVEAVLHVIHSSCGGSLRDKGIPAEDNSSLALGRQRLTLSQQNNQNLQANNKIQTRKHATTRASARDIYII